MKTNTEVSASKNPSFFQRMKTSIATRIVAATLCVAAFLGVMTVTSHAQTDITGVITAVDGYLDAAIAVGIAVLLFVLGRKVVRRLIVALAFISFMFAVGHASAQTTDISGVITAVDGYLDAAIAVGIAVLLFVLGRKVVRRLI